MQPIPSQPQSPLETGSPQKRTPVEGGGQSLGLGGFFAAVFGEGAEGETHGKSPAIDFVVPARKREGTGLLLLAAPDWASATRCPEAGEAGAGSGQLITEMTIDAAAPSDPPPDPEPDLATKALSPDWIAQGSQPLASASQKAVPEIPSQPDVLGPRPHQIIGSGAAPHVEIAASDMLFEGDDVLPEATSPPSVGDAGTLAPSPDDTVQQGVTDPQTAAVQAPHADAFEPVMARQASHSISTLAPLMSTSGAAARPSRSEPPLPQEVSVPPLPARPDRARQPVPAINAALSAVQNPPSATSKPAPPPAAPLMPESKDASPKGRQDAGLPSHEKPKAAPTPAIGMETSLPATVEPKRPPAGPREAATFGDPLKSAIVPPGRESLLHAKAHDAPLDASAASEKPSQVKDALPQNLDAAARPAFEPLAQSQADAPPPASIDEAFAAPPLREAKGEAQHSACSPHASTSRAVGNSDLLERFSQMLRDGDGKSFEIELNPRELGRVTFQMRTTAEGLTVQISTERQDTQDLVRRHIDELARELRSLGHGSVAFGFGNSGQRQPDRWSGGYAEVLTSPEPAEIDAPHAYGRLSPLQGIDIRV